MTMNMKKTLTTLLAATMMTAMFASCGAAESTESTATEETTTEETTTEETSTEETTEEATETESTLPDAAISVCSREDGSGTRGAFIELFGIEEKDEEGNKVDKTTTAAEITNSTAVMMSTIAGNEYGIGYISLGSLDDSVKALKVDGVEATAENIENGSYTVQRPFNIVTSETVSDAAQDFINFIMSDEGQAVVSEEGYIPVESTGAYEASVSEGKVTIGGSSSVTPVMEKLREAYLEVNPNMELEVSQSDSTTGITSAAEGVVDIGMASRALDESETSLGLTPTVIAMDGIAVIVNNNNALDDITTQQVYDIFTGAVTNWSELSE